MKVPEGWTHSQLGEIANIQVGRDLIEDCFSAKETEVHCYPIYSNTVENRGLYGFYNFQEYSGNAITIVGRGIGLGTAFARYDSEPFGAIGRLLVLSPKNDSFDVVFLADYVNFCLRIHNESGGIPQLPGASLSKYFVTLPPLHEQKKIAQILSTWDKAINTTEQLLANSQQQKKALMQQLLTGKKRLLDEDGVRFSGEWLSKFLGDFCEISTGKSNREDSTSSSGMYTFFDRSQDIRTSNIFLFDAEAVIVAGEGQEFVPKHFSGKFDLHQRTYAIMGFANSWGKFIYFYLGHFNSFLLSQAVGSTVKSLRLPMFQKMPIKLPSLKEQQKIATVLTTADREIELLQTKLEALKQEKIALMQQLLTGKRRVNFKGGNDE